MSITIEIRGGTGSNWTTVNPILAPGELGAEENYSNLPTKLKCGDGSTSWNSLAYVIGVQPLTSFSRGSSSSTTLTTATITNIGSITLTPGLWDVTGVLDYGFTGVTGTHYQSGVSNVSATFAGQDSYADMPLITTVLTDGFSHVLPVWQFDTRTASGNTPVYLIGKATFSVGTVTAFGTIRARQMG